MYRIVDIRKVRNVTTLNIGVTWSETRRIVKSGFANQELAQTWNLKYGNVAYVIESY